MNTELPAVFYKNMTVSLATILLLLHAVNKAGADSDSGMSRDYLQKITFPTQRSARNYARLNTTLSQNLTSLTLCLHVNTTVIYEWSTMCMVSYAYGQEDDELSLYKRGKGLTLYISGVQATLTNAPVWDGEWHVICVTWSNSDGTWHIYSDGVRSGTGSGLSVGGRVHAGGTWILGQDQGSFQTWKAFSGEMSQVNLWDRVLSPAEIATNWTVSCNKHGNVIDWTATDIEVFGDTNSDQYDCASETPDYTSLGCWKDGSGEDRTIPTLEGIDPLLDGSYCQRSNAIEKCYLVALSRGFTVFAVYNGGCCAGSADAHNTYKQHGQSTDCSWDGTGGSSANEVYQITAAYTTNIAFNRSAAQSSTASGGAAGRAVDGNRVTRWPGAYCARTTSIRDPNPWWRVDMGSTKYVDRVVVYSSAWRNDFQVHVGDNSDVVNNPTCDDAQRVAATDYVFIVNCGGQSGQYVGIALGGTYRILTLCEVEVYGGRTMVQSTSTSPTTPHVTSSMDSTVIASINVSLTLTVPRPVNISSLRESIRNRLEDQAGDFCDDQCKIGEIFLHIVNGTNRTRKKRQADDEVQIIVIIQLIVSASQGGNTSTDRNMTEDLLQESANLLRQLARGENLSVDVNGKKVYLFDNSDEDEVEDEDEDKKTPPWVIGVICAAVAVIIIVAVVTVLLCRRKHNPDANMPGKSGNEMKNLDTPERHDHTTGEGSVDNIIYNTEDEGFVDNVIYNAGDDGTVDNVIYQGQDSTPNDPENTPESQYESVY
ncbi:NPTX2 [Branchiostoma lanceolatum]|uniref:NPTX2 protein n=1 Tax=Branchiostoma lanceolatum TaxID=7740 RepID=A0A8K0ER89_BRALA|nr:NPTX2 [Branchiostoma lanceolatum]